MKERGIRLDLLIAVCALLISSLAAGASFWQARVMEQQTSVLQEQLGAQVWPYVSTSMSIDSDVVHVSIENDGLGPAVLRGATILVDGKPLGGFVDVLHAILGPNLVGRARHGEKISLAMSDENPGSVIRAGQSIDLMTFGSKRYATKMESAYGRITFRVCYCAVLPGKCWQGDSSSTKDPKPVAACADDPRDLLHAALPAALLDHRF